MEKVLLVLLCIIDLCMVYFTYQRVVKRRFFGAKKTWPQFFIVFLGVIVCVALRCMDEFAKEFLFSNVYILWACQLLLVLWCIDLLIIGLSQLFGGKYIKQNDEKKLEENIEVLEKIIKRNSNNISIEDRDSMNDVLKFIYTFFRETCKSNNYILSKKIKRRLQKKEI